MKLAIDILVGIVALFHLYTLWLEMFAWTTRGPKVFKNFDKELFPKTKALAANQGLYNGFLAAGLIWTFFICDHHWQFSIRLFFLGCVIVAGVYGAFTADKKIFFVQALPALITVVLMHFVPCSCCNTNCKTELVTKNDYIRGYYIGNHPYNKMDTLSVLEFHKPDINDSIIQKVKFEFIDKLSGEISYHEVVLYTNLNHAVGVDGEEFSASLDDLGIIYSHALSWGNVSVLKTNNDRLNSIISVGLAKIASNRTEVEQEMIYNSSKERN